MNASVQFKLRNRVVRVAWEIGDEDSACKAVDEMLAAADPVINRDEVEIFYHAIGMAAEGALQ